MNDAARTAPDDACPSRRAVELIANKWALLIIPELRKGPRRNNELLRCIPGISQKMLTQTLRELEGGGLVNRIDHHTRAPHVQYSLSAMGISLSSSLEPLDAWVRSNQMQLDQARAVRDDGDD